MDDGLRVAELHGALVQSDRARRVDVEAEVAAAVARPELADGRGAVLRGPVLELRELVGRRHRLGAAERAKIVTTNLHLHVACLADRLLAAWKSTSETTTHGVGRES